MQTLLTVSSSIQNLMTQAAAPHKNVGQPQSVLLPSESLSKGTSNPRFAGCWLAQWWSVVTGARRETERTPRLLGTLSAARRSRGESSTSNCRLARPYSVRASLTRVAGTPVRGTVGELSCTGSLAPMSRWASSPLGLAVPGENCQESTLRSLTTPTGLKTSRRSWPKDCSQRFY